MAESELVTKKDIAEAVAEIKTLVREVQDVLLAHFRSELNTHAMRIQALEESHTSLVNRLYVIEERLLNLEMRPTIRPS